MRFSQAVAANKTMLITEYAKRPAQPYCAALRGALAAGVGSYAWELMLGIDQFGPLEGAGPLSIGPPYKRGPVYQGTTCCCNRHSNTVPRYCC